jgi:hypothetical protein
MTKSKKKLRADKLVPITVATDPSVTTSPDIDSGEKSTPSTTKARASLPSTATRKQS